MSKQVFFQDLGRKEYKETWDYQEEILKAKVEKKTEARKLSEHPDFAAAGIQNDLIFVEHPLVYTLGKTGHEENVLISDKEREERGIEYFHINRGGDITFHGPGQIVGYPILDLEQFKPDLGWYLRNLEQVIIDTVAEYGIDAGRSTGETGVWINPDHSRKICAMGIRCSRWVTMHGFALNVNTEMDYFNYIVPCGIQNKSATSIEKEIGHKVDMEEVKEKLRKNFEKVFEVEMVLE
ncbi:MAG: lipoate-protein ligase B [Pseudopedobacter saltans]|uniref:Octanoyltransferase n=1 Tax=Pseudopedobacter saltans TaxID=151895 RepID=A0A2W5FCD0_9SPHI|nr:MAG: lipoate-protein ligase B [Pseudopedobacter saltans]